MWFDSAAVSYNELLDAFWQIHNPTIRNRQGLDIRDQYRSAIFYHSSEQQAAALASRGSEQIKHRRPIVTEIVPASAFHRAEEYHQRYFEKPGRTACAATLRRIASPQRDDRKKTVDAKTIKTEREWREKLTPQRYEILSRKGTE